MNTDSIITTVRAIAHQAASCRRHELTPLLLRLYPIVSASNLSFKEMRRIKEQVWRGDLMHILVEVLRQDFSSVDGTWDTAQQLVYILASVCSGLHPKASSTDNSEEVSEFYEILLPTAVDTILILASNILQAITDCVYQSECTLKSTTDSLLSICRSHQSLVSRVLQSPYLLHMLITDSVDLACELLRVLGTLLRIDRTCLLNLQPETFCSILDELVYKISGTEEKSAFLSLDLLATVSSIDSNMLQLILSRYNGLLAMIRKWKFSHLEPNTELFIQQIESTDVTSAIDGAVDIESQAAVVIQTSWRGYAARKKMKLLQNGIRKFQRFYRKWKAHKEEIKRDEFRAKQVLSVKQESTKQGRIAFLESQVSLVQQLPSSDVSSFIRQQEVTAAIKIQSQWRAYLAQKKYSQLQKYTNWTKSATVIQKAFRRFLQRKKAKCEGLAFALQRIEKTEQELLQREISQVRESRGQKNMSENAARELHNQVQGLLEQFYMTRHVENRKSDQLQLGLSQLERITNVLSSAPSLSESFARDNIRETFSSSSHHIAHMALVAHKEELASTNSPWWKHSHTIK